MASKRRLTWREGSNAILAELICSSACATCPSRLQPHAPWPEGRFQVELPKDEVVPTRYWLSILPFATTRHAMVDQAKLRWRIERDYQDLKQKLGLGHYEGRGSGLPPSRHALHRSLRILIVERGAFAL